MKLQNLSQRIRLPKRLLVIVGVILLLYCLPGILTNASLFYFRDWQQNAERSAAQIAAGKSYCIVVPYYSGWLVPKQFSRLPIRKVISTELYRRFRRLDIEFGEKRNSIELDDIHFGIVVGKKLYYWSFMKQAFFDALEHHYNNSVYRDLRFIKQLVERGKASQSLSSTASAGTSVYRAHSGGRQGDMIDQIKDIKGYYQYWLNALKSHHPQLSEADFICPHI